jgi:hypothetical protein
MGCMQAGVPFGIMLGYVLGGVMLEAGLDWRVAILFQLGLLVPLTLGHSYFPAINYQMHGDRDDSETESDGSDDGDLNNGARLSIDDNGDNSIFTKTDDGSPAVYNSVRSRRHSSQWSISDSPVMKHLTIMQSIRRLLKCEIYIYMSFGLAALYFVVTGVQFWVTTYFTQVLDVPRRSVLIAFTATSVTAPVLGVIGSGWVIDKLGGYKGTKGMARASKCCAGFAGLACLFAVPAAFINDFGAVIFCLWMVLLFGGAVVPIAAGLVLTAVPEGLQAFSFSLSICTYQLLGYGAGTFFPGLFIQLLENSGVDEDEALRWGFRIILLWGGWGVLFFALAMQVAVRNAKLEAAMESNAMERGPNSDAALTSVIVRLTSALSGAGSGDETKQPPYTAPPVSDIQKDDGETGFAHSFSTHNL